MIPLICERNNSGSSRDIISIHRLWLGACCDLSGLLRVDLLAVLVVSHAWWWGTDAASFSGADTNDLAVDSAAHTVLELEVHLWDGIFREDGSIRNITDGSRLDHVADGESLDCLVLWCASRAVGAADGLDVTAALLVAAV